MRTIAYRPRSGGIHWPGRTPRKRGEQRTTPEGTAPFTSGLLAVKMEHLRHYRSLGGCSMRGIRTYPNRQRRWLRRKLIPIIPDGECLRL